jgi:hypothetical protein
VLTTQELKACMSLVPKWKATVARWISTRGALETIQMLKRIRVILYRHLAGDPLYVFGVAQYKSGLPRILGPEVASLIESGNT